MQAASDDVALRLPIRFMPAPVERTSHPKYVTILLLDQSASTAHALTERKTVLLKRSRCVLIAIRLYAADIGWSFLLIMSITARTGLPKEVFSLTERTMQATTRSCTIITVYYCILNIPNHY